MAITTRSDLEPRPFVDAAYIRVLLASGLVPSDHISTQAKGAAAQLPAVRVTVLPDISPTAWATSTAQLDVWAATPAEAGLLATAIGNYWRSLQRGDTGDMTIHMGWVESWPASFPDPDTDAARYLMEVGLVLSHYGGNNGG